MSDSPNDVTKTSAILDVAEAVVRFETRQAVVTGLASATLRIEAGETVGLVGESGSGKSTLGLLVGRLLPASAKITASRLQVDGRDLLAMTSDQVRALRRECLGFIPQDPIAALDPTMRIGRQLALVLRGLPRAKSDLIRHLEAVRMRDPERVLRAFPHEISGGMAQRVMIAMAMARQPRLLIADEPTAALDTQVRAEVAKLVFSLAAESGTTVLWLSHDLRSVGRWCDRVAVMYGGEVVEDGPAQQVLEHPRHPYTIALASADPARSKPGERLRIATYPPVALGVPLAESATANGVSLL